jgi:glyoxylase-like metal-dependent hydrolase (beta-lactamase superfamily II)
MKRLAPGVWQLGGFPPNAINIYLIGDVLIDTGTRWASRRIVRQLEGRPLSLVALTHCHPDHQGAANAVCEKFGVPLACHEADVAVMEGRTPMLPRTPAILWADKYFAGPPRRVDQVLQEGDEVAGFRVIHAPGHTAGRVIYFRDSDRVAIAGDVLANIHFLTGRSGLREPPPSFSADPAQNRQSMGKLAQLRPSLVCFGHGPPLRNLESLQSFVEARLSAGGRRD